VAEAWVATGAANDVEPSVVAVKAERRPTREEHQVRVAITASGPDLSSPVDQRFGRARYLLIVETSDRKVQAIDNNAGMNAAQGAGVQAAQTVIDNNASVLITGHCGPKAFRALQAGGVHVYLSPETTVDDAITAFQQGDLKHTSTADVDSHW
jgi:predicted Fe-Mo cluster-binding NifX family protein